MAYDSSRGVSVLFGGHRSGTGLLPDTWEYDGISWKLVTPTDPEGDDNPGGRSLHGLVYNSASNTMTLFAGYRGGGGFDDTWKFDGTSWQRLNTIDSDPFPEPAGRMDHSLTYDSSRGVAVLFGGSYDAGSEGDSCSDGTTAGWSGYCRFSDTWEYDRTKWKQVTPADPEDDGNPERRYQHSLTYDSVRGVVVLYGGRGEDWDRFSDTWEYDGTSWKLVTPTDPEDDGNPEGRMYHSLAYDSTRGVVVLFGGWEGTGGNTYASDTWEYDGISWRLATPSDPENDGNPEGRKHQALAYDSTRGVMVLFGGMGSSYPPFSDTWEYDGTSWREVIPADPEGDGNPSDEIYEGRLSPSMIYDAARGVIVLLGGAEQQGEYLLSDVWEYDGTSWEQIIPSDSEGDGSPDSNLIQGVYDSSRGDILIFGRSAIDWQDSGIFAGTPWVLKSKTAAVLSASTAEASLPFGAKLTRASVTVVTDLQVGRQTELVIAQGSHWVAASSTGSFIRNVTETSETVSVVITEPAQLKRIAHGLSGVIRARLTSQRTDVSLAEQSSVNLNYFELRFRYNLNEIATSVEPRCGDGIFHVHLGEMCDDLNTVSGDGCSFTCQAE